MYVCEKGCGCFFVHLHDHTEGSCVGRVAGVLLGEHLFEVVPVSFHVVVRQRRPGKHQSLPALAFGVADGVDEELEILRAELGS